MSQPALFSVKFLKKQICVFVKSFRNREKELTFQQKGYRIKME